jgi:hypothetical protein
MSEEIDRLTGAEMMLLAGLVRKLVRMDGHFTDAERDGIAKIAQTVTEDDAVEAGTPYRADVKAPKPIGAKALFERIEQASEKYPDDQTLRTAALALTRPEAREIIHALLFDVAASDAIGKGEADLLEWLEEKWELESSEVVDGQDEGDEDA